MKDTNGEKYINALVDLYQVKEIDHAKLNGAYDKINDALEKFLWSDVERAINYYFVHKSDKSRPKLAQILAILNLWDSEGKIQVFEKATEPVEKRFETPRTKLWTIMESFNRLVGVLTDAGVLPDENGKIQNNRSIIDPETDMVVLHPLEWLKHKLWIAKNTRPDLFAKFPNATILEELAIACQNKLITIRVRDWGMVASDARNYNGVQRGA